MTLKFKAEHSNRKRINLISLQTNLFTSVNLRPFFGSGLSGLRWRIILFCLILSTQFAHAEFIWNDNCVEAYNEVSKLNFRKANQILTNEKKLHPDNLIPLYIESEMDFLHSFISEDEVILDKLKKNNEARIDLIEKNKEHSPYSRLLIGEMYIQMAIARVKFEEFIGTMYDTRKAYKILTENKTLYPDFKPNLRGIGIIHTVIGAIPKNYQWIVNLLGMDGSIKQGFSELKQLLAATYSHPELSWEREDIIVILTFLEVSLEKDKNKDILRKRFYNINDLDEKPMLQFAKSVFHLACSENDSIISLLENRKQIPNAYQIDYLNYMEGTARLNNLDFSAEKSFLLYVNNYKGKSFINSAWQRLAWCRLLQGDIRGYQTYINHCLENTKINTLSDEDSQATKEAQTKEVPNIPLLRSRVLFDGGYYIRSLNEIAGKPMSAFPKLRDQLEFTYRLARIFDKTGKKDKAEQYYIQTLNNGDMKPYYFAANSALMLGLLKEEAGDTVVALDYFKKCLAMRNHEYQNSIDQKAKAGINRLSK